MGKRQRLNPEISKGKRQERVDRGGHAIIQTANSPPCCTAELAPLA